MGCTAIYVLSRAPCEDEGASLALSRLRAACERVLIVCADKTRVTDDLGQFADAVLEEKNVAQSFLYGLQAGLLAELERDLSSTNQILATGDHALGPTGDVAALFERLDESQAALFSPYCLITDEHVQAGLMLEHVPHLDFSIFARTLLQASGFKAFWRGFEAGNPWSQFHHGLVRFGQFLRDGGHDVLYTLPEPALNAPETRLYDALLLLEHGAPCLPLDMFLLDPFQHDINASEIKPAIDHLRAHDPDLYRVLIQYVTQNLPMREFNAIADQTEVFETAAESPEKTDWAFGTVAAFLHVYYADMIEELEALVAKIPTPVHLFISTASEEDRAEIQQFLDQKGYAEDALDIRVVEQNRGRDMSALFITFADVIRSDRYQVALRLHSKRTPQTSVRIAESFKAHLFDNLVVSKGYIGNLLNRMEAEPDIGLVVPPLIHVGFSTLGHSWFTNRPRVEEIAKEMGIDVPLDYATPVTPYGTMFWFRTDALRPMFEWPWKWESYNKEPNHVDGGLAHAQERIIGYCAQSQGYRVLTVMSPKAAARLYSKLEYKMQRLASHLSTPKIDEQETKLRRGKSKLRETMFCGVNQSYRFIITRVPGARNVLQPLTKIASRFTPR